MIKKLFLLLTLTSFTSVIQAKHYTITEEDKACTNDAEGYNELADCFSKIGNKADDYTIAFLKAKSNKLYKQYYNEADKVTKACKKKYFDDGRPFARAEYHQCYMDRMLYLGEKYDRIINGR